MSYIEVPEAQIWNRCMVWRLQHWGLEIQWSAERTRRRLEGEATPLPWPAHLPLDRRHRRSDLRYWTKEVRCKLRSVAWFVSETMFTILPYIVGWMTFRLLEMYSRSSWSVDRFISLLLMSIDGSRKSKITLHCSSFWIKSSGRLLVGTSEVRGATKEDYHVERGVFPILFARWDEIAKSVFFSATL